MFKVFWCQISADAQTVTALFRKAARQLNLEIWCLSGLLEK